MVGKHDELNMIIAGWIVAVVVTQRSKLCGGPVPLFEANWKDGRVMTRPGPIWRRRGFSLQRVLPYSVWKSIVLVPKECANNCVSNPSLLIETTPDNPDQVQ